MKEFGFSDSSFGIFFAEFDIDIHSEKYRQHGTSKANKLRSFWLIEDDRLVGRVLNGLIEYLVDKNPKVNRDVIEECKRIAQRLIGFAPSLAPLKEVAAAFNAQHMAEQVRRMEAAIDQDPAWLSGLPKNLLKHAAKPSWLSEASPCKAHRIFRFSQRKCSRI